MTPGHRHLRRARPAFTLVELLVALAVMALALSVVGVVFKITTETASQAAAYSEVDGWVRQFLNQLGEDLRYADPASSVMYVRGSEQCAALTEDDRVAARRLRFLDGDPDRVPAAFSPQFSGTVDRVRDQYSNPRCDILAFFSNRPTVSQCPPLNPPTNPAMLGTKFAPVWITYGHAALDEGVETGAGWDFANRYRHIRTADPQEISPVPAGEWHLARRATILNYIQNRQPPPFGDSAAFSAAELDRLVRCWRPETSPTLAGDIAALDLPAFLKSVSQPAYVLWPNVLPWDYAPHNDIRRAFEALLYRPGSAPHTLHTATVIPNPAPELRSNLGVHMLPGCASFQVEFLMPEDPRNSLIYRSPENPDQDPATYSTRYDPLRWVEVDPDATYVFLPDTSANRLLISSQDPAVVGRLTTFGPVDPTLSGAAFISAANKRIRLWPYAIRVTVRVFDSRGRLKEPLVRSLVHRFD